jgi:hypothetical protein
MNKKHILTFLKFLLYLHVLCVPSLHCKKGYRFSRPQPVCYLPNYPLTGNNLNYSRPVRVWLVTSRLGTGKSLTFFYSVGYLVSAAEVGGFALRPLRHLVDDVVQDHHVLHQNIIIKTKQKNPFRKKVVII